MRRLRRWDGSRPGDPGLRSLVLTEEPAMARKKAETNHAETNEETSPAPVRKRRRATRAPKNDQPDALDVASSREDDLLGRMVYGTAYAVSYAIAFPVVLLTHSIPGASALVPRCHDGV